MSQAEAANLPAGLLLEQLHSQLFVTCANLMRSKASLTVRQHQADVCAEKVFNITRQRILPCFAALQSCMLEGRAIPCFSIRTVFKALLCRLLQRCFMLQTQQQSCSAACMHDHAGHRVCCLMTAFWVQHDMTSVGTYLCVYLLLLTAAFTVVAAIAVLIFSSCFGCTPPFAACAGGEAFGMGA